MDVLEYGRVIRRQAFVFGLGLAITFALMFLALVRVSADGIVLRSPPVYQANSELLVTKRGFPWGRIAPPDYQQLDTARMEYLAGLYAQLATSEEVRVLIEQDGTRLPLPRSAYDVVQSITLGSQHPLPLIEVTGRDTSSSEAVAIANRVAQGMQQFILLNQQRNGTPESERVELRVVTRATKAEVLQGVKLTTPIMLFVLGMVVTLVVAFTRDNVQRNRRPPKSQGPPLEDSGESPVELESVPHEPPAGEDVIVVPRRRAAGGGPQSP